MANKARGIKRTGCDYGKWRWLIYKQISRSINQRQIHTHQRTNTWTNGQNTKKQWTKHPTPTPLLPGGWMVRKRTWVYTDAWSTQTQFRLARIVLFLAPPELETVRAWLKPTYRSWFAHASLLFGQIARALTEIFFFSKLSRQILSYYRIRDTIFK